MIGIGLDAVDVDRFRQSLQRRPRLIDRLFTAGEQAYASRQRDPAQRYAARFAAKEAVLKALGVGLGACPFTDIEVVKLPSGAPGLVLHGRAAELAAARGVGVWKLSLTHTDLIAQAVAVAEPAPVEAPSGGAAPVDAGVAEAAPVDRVEPGP